MCGRCARFVPDTNYREVNDAVAEAREAAVIESLNHPPAQVPVSAERAKELFAEIHRKVGQ